MRVADVGKLILGVMWDGASVCGADIRSTRVMAAQILKDKAPAQVLQIVPLLFGVCGRAQSAAADAALHAARGSERRPSATTERMIACEALQEHLWRVMLDWPKLLGLTQQAQHFAGWHGMLRKIAVGELDMAIFLREFERDWLGSSAASWQGMDSHQALQTWWRKTESPAAHLLAKLAECEPDMGSVGRLLPAWSAAAAQQACAGKWNAAFASRPDWQGDAAETGAWAYYADTPLLRDVWLQSRSKALTRLLARLWDVLELAGSGAPARLDATGTAEGEGVAVVRTARGLLMHYVHLATDRVTDYAIVAPTEWNFHPAGAFAQDLRGIKECDVGRMQQLAHIEALSLDPCVAYEIEVRHA